MSSMAPRREKERSTYACTSVDGSRGLGERRIPQSKSATKGTEGRRGEHCLEVRSASRDALSEGRGRDYRGFVLLHKELTGRNNITILVFGMRIREEGGYILTANLFSGDGCIDDAPMVDLLAYRHHMRWLKMCEDKSAGDQKSRKGYFREHLHCFQVAGWEVKIIDSGGIEEDRIPTLNPCRFCKKCAKTPYSPGTFYGGNLITEKVAWGRTNCIKDEPYACGMTQGEVSYPLLNMNWRAPGPLFPLAVEYRSAVDVDFSLLAVQNVATLGNRLARESGDVRLAARRVQEIEMRTSEPQVRATATLLRNHPALQGRIAQLHTIGALPFLHGKSPENPMPLGLPYDASKTAEIVQKLWKDVREGRVLISTPHVAGDDAPLISTPTTTVRKRMPDRTMSDDFRIISDLRYPNFSCDKAGCPEVKTTDIRSIAEKAVAMKTKWPHVEIQCNKSDIEAAFKRSKVHPDVCAILCTEFKRNLMGIEDDDATVLFLHLTLPFGWRGSPAYFSEIGEGVTLTHQ